MPIFGGGGGGGVDTDGWPAGCTAYVGMDADTQDIADSYDNVWYADGTADDVQVQAAVDYVGGLGGGCVCLGPGVYDITTPVLIQGYDDVVLKGCGYQNTCLKAAGDNYIIGIGHRTEPTDGAYRTQIRNIFFNGTNQPLSTEYPWVDLNQTLIYVASYSDFTVVDECWLYNAGNDALFGWDCGKVTTLNSVFTENRSGGLNTYGPVHFHGGHDVNQHIVMGCRFLDNDAQNSVRHAAVIVGNVFSNSGSCIGSDMSTTYSGNHVYYGGGYSGWNSGEGESITGNFFWYVDKGAGVSPRSSASVVGNVVYYHNTSSYGISWGNYNNITCVGNVIVQPNLSGIQLIQSCFNTVANNVVTGVRTAVRPCIRVENSCTDNVIMGNRLDATGAAQGIQFITGTNSRNIVIENWIYNAVGDGIKFENSGADNVVKDNILYGNGGYGVNISAATITGTIVRNNIFWSNTSGPLNDIGVGTILETLQGEFDKYGGGSGGLTAPVINTSPGGIDIDADDEFCYAYVTLPMHLQKVIRIKLWAYSNVVEATNNMLLRLVAHAGGSSEQWGTEAIDVANEESIETGGIIANDVLHWVFDASDDSDIGDLAAQDYVEIMAVGEAAGAPDVATDALFGGWEIEYV